MKKISILLLCLQVHAFIISQNMILHDPVSAKVFNTSKYSEIRGTPFLFDKWMTGSVNIAKGRYDNLQLKFDVYSNTLFFNRNEETFEFQDHVVGFTLMPVVSDSSTYLYFRKGISGHSLKDNQFVQILAEGPVSIYKSDIKLLSELNEINRGVVKSFSNSSRYFVEKQNTLQLIKLNKNEVLGILSDKEGELSSYISQNKLSFKKETDIIRMVSYYNSLEP